MSSNGREPPSPMSDSVQREKPALMELERSHDNTALRRIRFGLWKNGIVLSLAWFCLYMGYNSISAIQSSLNARNGLGVVTMCVEFATMTFGNLFTDSSIIRRLGCKWTVTLGMGMYAVYIASNFYPAFYTMVPLAAVSGITSAAMWVAQSTYLTRLGIAYGTKLGYDADRYKGRFLGILYMGYLSSNVVGNAVSSLILGSNVDDTVVVSAKRLEICGASYCNEDLKAYDGPSYRAFVNVSTTRGISAGAGASRNPGDLQVYLFCGFCVACAVLATFIVFVFLDTLPNLDIEEGIGSDLTTKQLLLASMAQWKDIKQVLLIPIGLYNGMDNPFWSAEFTKAFITCPIGIHFIGYVMMVFGLTSATVAVVFGWLSSSRFRIIPFLMAFACHCGTAVTLLFWKTDPAYVWPLFVFSAIWGTGTGVWSSQVPIYYSVIFPDNLEAAFSNSRIWDAIGRTMSYGWSYPLCTFYKIYLVLTIMVLGTVGLIVIEVYRYVSSTKWRLKTTKKQTTVHEDDGPLA